MSQMEQEQIFKTSDQGFAAYIMERGYYCVRAIPSGDKRFPDRKDLVFIDVEDPKQLEDDYFRYKKDVMSARSYFEKVRTVRHIIRNGLSEEELNKLKSDA